MRNLQRRDAPRRQRRDDVLLRLAYPDEGAAQGGAIFRYGLALQLREVASIASEEILAKLAGCRLPLVEAELDADVTEAMADELNVIAKGPQCVLRSAFWPGALPVDIVVCSAPRKGEKGKRRKDKRLCSRRRVLQRGRL